MPNNPQYDIREGLKFSESAEYKAEVEKVVASAKAACEANMNIVGRTVVYDIDETCLDNRELIRNVELALNPTYLKVWDAAAWTKWTSEARGPEITPVADFLRWAKSKGFVLIGITARDSDERVGTEENLRKRNIPFDAVYLKPLGFAGRSEDFKTQYRRMLQDQGYTVVCNIGDQFSDLYGLNAIDCEKLPNRMYFTE